MDNTVDKFIEWKTAEVLLGGELLFLMTYSADLLFKMTDELL